MSSSRLQFFSRQHVALPPLKFGVRARLIEECQRDPGLRRASAKEAQHALHVRAQVARAGWWN
jgi:hypothetical protein